MIKKLDNGEPIDMVLLNKIISRLNALDDADKLTAIAQRSTQYKSTEDNIIVQGFRKQGIKLTRDATGYHGNIGNVAFPVPFADIPVVTVTFDSCTYMLPYVTSVSTTGFNLGGMRLSQTFADVPTSVNFNVIAIGASRVT